MATVFHSQGVGQPILVEDLLAKYGEPEVGRWAKAPGIPDRCEFCPLGDIRIATGYVSDADGWRYGYCPAHQQEANDYIAEVLAEEQEKLERTET